MTKNQTTHTRTQIYEIQTPQEAEDMIRLGVDNIGSVIQHASSIKNQALKETVDLVKSDGADSGRESSIIPLFSDLTAIFEVINYYDPDQ